MKLATSKKLPLRAHVIGHGRQSGGTDDGADRQARGVRLGGRAPGSTRCPTTLVWRCSKCQPPTSVDGVVVEPLEAAGASAGRRRGGRAGRRRCAGCSRRRRRCGGVAGAGARPRRVGIQLDRTEIDLVAVGDRAELDEHRCGVRPLWNGLAQDDQASVVAREVLAGLLGECGNLLALRDRRMQLVDLIVQLRGLVALRPQNHHVEADRQGDHRDADQDGSIAGLHLSRLRSKRRSNRTRVASRSARPRRAPREPTSPCRARARHRRPQPARTW